MNGYTVVPVEGLEGIYESGGWSFSINPEDDGDLEFVDNAIASWVAWREFLIHRENEKNQETLF